MSSGPQENSNQTMFSSGTPHFFTIILEETLQENKLRIPQKFIRKCPEPLSNWVFVKLPCGLKWKMKLKKQDDKIWFEKGWPDFAKHYSIKRGSMLIFGYEGKSVLHAVIFDTSTVEIDYPSIPGHFDKSNIDLELRGPKQEVFEDDSVESLDDLLPCPKTRVKSPLPCSQPHKRMRMSPNAETQNNSSDPKSKGSHHSECVLRNSKTKGNLQSSEPEMIGMKNLQSSHNSVFVSKRPCFKVVMQPTYLRDNRVAFPTTFAAKYFKNNSCNVILKVMDGRTWSVKYTCGEYNKVTARFQTGWKEFARDNNLEVGDICVFVLLKDIKISFEVTIFRVNENSKTPMSPAHKGGEIHVEPEQILRNKTKSRGAINDETSMPISHRNLPAKQSNVCKSTPSRTKKKHSLNFVEKTRILERAHSKSEKPFFKIVIKSSYSCTGPSYHLNIPVDFARKYIKNEGDIVLCVPNGRSWPAKFRFRRLRHGNHVAEIYGGWKEFAFDNYLEVGNVCNFRLLNGTEISFEVSIVRVVK